MVSSRGLKLAVIAGAAVALAAGSADAATKKKRLTVNGQSVEYVQAAPSTRGTVFTTRGEDGHTRTKIIVEKRSYLDGGTEVLPGQRKFTDYVYPPGYQPSGALGSRYNTDRQPLNGMFDFGSTRF